MRVTSTGIIDGVIQDRYGKRGELYDFGMPACSMPLEFHDAPEETKTFAIFLEDKDAYPVSGGFAWVHWLAANIEGAALPEDASRTMRDVMVQGANSWTSMQGGSNPPARCSCYGGMACPDRGHLYEINVYALDAELDLSDGFLLNDLFHAIDGHVLDHAVLKGWYEA